MGIDMEYRKHLDKNTIIYLVNEITKHHGIKNVPVLKTGRLLYLLWLEYASLYPEYKYPKDSPMNNMTFMNGESGAFEEMFYSHHDEIKKEIPYVMQIKQGNKYTDDYLVSEANSEDTKNETISLTSSTSSSEMISAAYAAQVQALQYDSTATMMSDAYLNLSSIKNKKSYFGS